MQWCKEKGKPIPRFTLYPRTKGFVATIKELGTSSSVKAVYDLTIAYAHEDRFLEAPTMWQTLSEPRLDRDRRFHVHAERFDIADLAGKSDAELAAWLEERWIAKSKKLQALQRSLEDDKPWGEPLRSQENGKKES